MKPSPPVTITRRGVIIAAGIAGVAMGLAVTAVVWIALQVNDVQQAEIRANQRDIAALKRTDERLRRIEQPTNEQLTNAALRALRAIRSCARSARCRKRNPGVASVARSIPRGRIPRRVPRRSGSGGASAPTSGGASSPRAPASGGSTRPQDPTPTGSARQPTTRPTPAPANPPASRPTSPPAAQNPSGPGPGPAATVSTPAPPPVNVPQPPSPPPLPVPVPPIPPLPGVCTPAVNVNCPKAP